MERNEKNKVWQRVEQGFGTDSPQYVRLRTHDNNRNTSDKVIKNDGQQS